MKIQDYDEEPVVWGEPPLGQFAHKRSVDVGLRTFSITIPYAPFYGVHIDVTESECPSHE